MSGRSATTEGPGRMCLDCKRIFEDLRAPRIHRTLAHGGRPDHGGITRYRKGCRCEACRRANREQKRRDRAPYRGVARRIDGSPETLRACLVAFGVSEADLARATRERPVHEAHWGAWRASGKLRKHCRCEAPREIAEELRRSA